MYQPFSKMEPAKSSGRGNEQGFVLISVILFLVIFMILGMTLMYKITATVKVSGLNKLGMIRFQGAEGGAIAVASYMSKYRGTNVPQDILQPATGEYSATAQVLGDSISYPLGYSSLWRGVNMQINSVSPPAPNDKTEIETVVFIPLTPIGYGNNE